MKFFVFLLIFLLAETAICDGGFRERRDATEEDKKVVNEKIRKKIDEWPTRNRRQTPGVSSAERPATDGIRTTHDNITSKSSSPDVIANRTHIADNEVRIRDKDCVIGSGAQIYFSSHEWTFAVYL